MANLLGEELRRRRDERRRERNRPAAEAWNRWFEKHGHAFIVGGAAEVDAVPTSYSVPADECPLTAEECWFLLRGYLVRPAQEVTADEFHRMPGHIELLSGYLHLRH